MSIEIGQIEAIFRYPVKSVRGEPLEAAMLGWHGLDGGPSTRSRARAEAHQVYLSTPQWRCRRSEAVVRARFRCERCEREDLSPKEEAAALEVLVRERSWSTRQVGEAITRSPMYVSKRLRVFGDPVLAAPVLANQLPVSTAEELLRVPEDERAQFVEHAIAERWGQADARQAVVERKVYFTGLWDIREAQGQQGLPV